MPWRGTDEAYAVFVSEMMLQQTQVERVKGKYEDFVCAFPSFSVLADSSLKDVLTVWQGLGYNRRALALIQGARIVMEKYGGVLPRHVTELTGLPGIGKATAAAIICFAFNEPVPFIETNIRRVFIDHYFGGEGDVKDADILPLVEGTLDRAAPREWFYALMDYGSMLGKGGENANRRSVHYRRQAPFPGSDRRIRGAILRTLLAEAPLSADAIGRETGADGERVLSLLSRMKEEGLVREDEGSYTIG